MESISGQIEVWGYAGCKGVIPCTRSLLYEDGGLFPGIYSFSDGEVLTFFRGTADHLNPQSNISMMRSTDKGDSWSAAEIVTAEADDRNPAVGIDGDFVLLVYASRTNLIQGATWQPDEYWKNNHWLVKYRVSMDRGRTWSEARDVPNPEGYTLCSPGGGCNILNHNGVLTVNVFGLKGDQQYRNQPVKEWWGFPMGYGRHTDEWLPYAPIECGSDETDFFSLPDKMGAMIRTGGVKFHACYVRYLGQLSAEWSKPILAFPDGMHPARMTALPKGIFMATVGRRRYPYGAMGLLSRDGGLSWDWDNQFILADNCGKGEQRGDNGYASSTLLPDGTILSVWYKNISDAPYFPGTGDKYTLEMAKYRLEDVLKWH